MCILLYTHVSICQQSRLLLFFSWNLLLYIFQWQCRKIMEYHIKTAILPPHPVFLFVVPSFSIPLPRNNPNKQTRKNKKSTYLWKIQIWFFFSENLNENQQRVSKKSSQSLVTAELTLSFLISLLSFQQNSWTCKMFFLSHVLSTVSQLLRVLRQWGLGNRVAAKWITPAASKNVWILQRESNRSCFKKELIGFSKEKGHGSVKGSNAHRKERNVIFIWVAWWQFCP